MTSENRNQNVSDLVRVFQDTHHYTRTRAENMDTFYNVLGITDVKSDHVENKKLSVNVDFLGKWKFTSSNPLSDSVTEVGFL